MQKGTFERTCLLADFELSSLGAAFPSKEPLSVLCVEERKIMRMPLGRRKKSFLLINTFAQRREKRGTICYGLHCVPSTFKLYSEYLQV